MQKKIKTSAVMAATVFMMVSGIASLSAQFIYRDNHIFVGQPPSNYTTVATSSSPGVYIGPDFSIEYWDGGLNFWRPALSTNYGNYKFFVGDDGNIGIGRKPTTELAKGTYVYNLTANGITLGSRRMINP
jgi:hypothetical protein